MPPKGPKIIDSDSFKYGIFIELLLFFFFEIPDEFSDLSSRYIHRRGNEQRRAGRRAGERVTVTGLRGLRTAHVSNLLRESIALAWPVVGCGRSGCTIAPVVVTRYGQHDRPTGQVSLDPVVLQRSDRPGNGAQDMLMLHPPNNAARDMP